MHESEFILSAHKTEGWVHYLSEWTSLNGLTDYEKK